MYVESDYTPYIHSKALRCHKHRGVKLNSDNDTAESKIFQHFIKELFFFKEEILVNFKVVFHDSNTFRIMIHS